MTAQASLLLKSSALVWLVSWCGLAAPASAQDHHLVGRLLQAIGQNKQYGTRTYVVTGLAAQDRTEDSIDAQAHLKGNAELVNDLSSVIHCAEKTALHSLRACHFINDPDDRAMFVQVTNVVRSASSVVVAVRVGGWTPEGAMWFSESIVTFTRTSNELGLPSVTPGRVT